MRFLRRLARRITRSRVPLVYHPGYARSHAGVPLDPDRGERVLAFLDDQGLLGRRDVMRPIPASMDALLRVHTPSYLESLDETGPVARALGVEVSDAERQAAIDLQRLVTGGTVHAFRLARRARGAAVNLGGGLHHALPADGMAFCLFNDIAVGIAHLRRYGMDAPVLVIDLDLHDGNGTRAAFASDPSVHTLSVHNVDWEPLGGSGATSVALGTRVQDDEYLSTIREVVPSVVASHAPGFVVYLAGTDPAADDRLGDWLISPGAMLERDRFVIGTVRDLCGNIPIGIVLGGGYGRQSWRYTARFLAWLTGGTPLEPPDELSAALQRFRAHAIQPFEKETDDGWGLTEQDLFAVATGGTADVRVLGAFSKYAIELSLERAGFLDALVRRGFSHPTVEVAVDSGLGETIRVYGDAARSELVMELRVRRSSRAVPGNDVLYVEWLRLQDPRARFTDANPKLPGQAHPGLGMLREVVAWLMVLCETLELDGMAFAPAEYYMAVLGRHHMRFVDPEAQARFDALYTLLRDLPLAEAMEALDRGRVIDARTGEAVRWVPALQMFPTSDRMKRALHDTRSDTAFRFELRPAP